MSCPTTSNDSTLSLQMGRVWISVRARRSCATTKRSYPPVNNTSPEAPCSTQLTRNECPLNFLQRHPQKRQKRQRPCTDDRTTKNCKARENARNTPEMKNETLNNQQPCHHQSSRQITTMHARRRKTHKEKGLYLDNCLVFKSHNKARVVPPHVTNRFDPGNTAMSATGCVIRPSLNVVNMFLVGFEFRGFHNLTVRSCPPVRQWLPASLRQTHSTAPVWPCSVIVLVHGASGTCGAGVVVAVVDGEGALWAVVLVVAVVVVVVALLVVVALVVVVA
jgi:hypothetical protein